MQKKPIPTDSMHLFLPSLGTLIFCFFFQSYKSVLFYSILILSISEIIKFLDHSGMEDFLYGLSFQVNFLTEYDRESKTFLFWTWDVGRVEIY